MLGGAGIQLVTNVVGVALHHQVVGFAYGKVAGAVGFYVAVLPFKVLPLRIKQVK